MMNPPPSLMEACYHDSKNPTKNAAHSTDVTSGDIKKYNLMQHRGGNSNTPGSLRPGISSRSHDALLLLRQGPEEQEEPEVLLSSFAHRSSPAGSEDHHNNCCSTFPRMLSIMLEDAESKGFANVVSWVPGQNNLFRVYDSETFTREIAPLYFKCTQYTSFQRQLNLYGFSRIKTGIYKGGYTHELLVRGSPEICDYMIRTKIKGGKSLRSPVSSMLSLTAGRPLFPQEKGEDAPRLPTSLEYRYKCEQENNKYSTITAALLESSNTANEARDSKAVFDRNEFHPRALQPGSLSSPSANHNDDGWVTKNSPRTTAPIFPSRQSSKLAFDSNTKYGGFSPEEIIDEIIYTFYS
jgi:hypothetical protein